MKKYIFQLVFFTSLIEELLLIFFNFFNFTNIYLIRNIFEIHILNNLLNYFVLLIINYLLIIFYQKFVKSNNQIIYFCLGFLMGLFYFGLFKVLNFHINLQFIDILCVILINIFKTYMICYSLFYKSLL